MIKSFVFLVLSLVSNIAYAEKIKVQALMNIRPDQVQTILVNVTDKSYECKGFVTTVTEKSILKTEQLIIMLPSGEKIEHTVLAPANDYFINAWSQFECE